MALTDTAIRGKLAPGRHTDGKGNGLALLVRENGAKFWTQRIKRAGKITELGHGRYPAVSLSEARKAAAAAKREADLGADPLTQKRVRKAQSHTLAQALDAYLAAHAAAWRSPKTEKIWKASLEKHAGRLLKRPVSAVSLHEVHSLLSAFWNTRPVIAGKVRARLEAIFEFAAAQGWRDGPNPAAWRNGLRPLLAKPSSLRRTRHYPALAWGQAPAFITALEDQGGDAARCLHLSILTACRSGEARGARWEEFDLDQAVWTIPGARMKTRTDHRIPLSSRAIALLRKIAATQSDPAPKAGLIFATRNATPFSDMALLAVVKRMHESKMEEDGIGWLDERGDRITPHGFRTTYRTWCGDHGYPREIAELSLAHRIGSEVEQAYARTDLLERRRAVMSDWASFLSGGSGKAGNG